jgi:integrase
MLKTRSGLPKHCTHVVDRHGKRRVRFRRRGVSQYLSGIPWSEEFMRQYAAALERETSHRAGVGASLRTIPGSFSALCVAYYTSADFAALRASTQAMQRGVLERFRRDHGHRRLAELKRIHLTAIVGSMKETPAAANNLIKILKKVLEFAVAQEMIAANPARGLRGYRAAGDGLRTWTEEEIARFEARHPLGTKARLAFALALYTAQRRGDLLRLGWQHVRGNRIALRQQKTGRELAIPIHPALALALSAAPRANLTFIVTERGAPYVHGASFSNAFRAWAEEAGATNATIHGLRKAACRRLAEAGCSANEIAAISGHSTLKEVARYTSAANQELLAERAMARQVATEGEQTLPNPATRAYPTREKL